MTQAKRVGPKLRKPTAEDRLWSELQLTMRHHQIELEREYRFAKPQGRDWRFDIAAPYLRLAMEVEGGIGKMRFSKDRKRVAMASRHAGTVAGFEIDQYKYQAAAALGWIVLHVTTRQANNGEASLIFEQFAELRINYSTAAACDYYKSMRCFQKQPKIKGRKR